MAWDETDHPIIKWAKLSVDHLTQIADVELATLKIHLVLEDGLRYLLAARLGLANPETALAKQRVEFALLLELALSGGASQHLLGALRALNGARNALAHHMESPDVQKNLAIFCMEIGYMMKKKVAWPSESPQQLAALRDAFDDAGAALFDLAVVEETKNKGHEAPTNALQPTRTAPRES